MFMINKNKNLYINYGELFLYFPFQLLDGFDNEKLNYIILDNPIIISEKYLENKKNELRDKECLIIEEVCKTIEKDERINVIRGTKGMKLEIKEDFKEECIAYINTIAKNIAIKNGLLLEDNSNLRIDFTESYLKFTIEDPEEEDAYRSLFDLAANKRIESKTYSSFFNEKHKKYIIKPCKMINKKGTTIWLRAELLYFENGMGIIKMNFPVYNTDGDFIKKYRLNDYFEKIITAEQIEFTNIEDYATYLYDNLFDGIEAYFERSMDLITLIDTNIELKDSRNVPNELKKEAYLITNAPVPEINFDDCLALAKEHFESNSFSLSQVLSVIRTTGGCLVIPSEKTKNKVFEDTKELEYKKEEINHIIARDVCCSTEFSLIVMMLETLNGKSTLFNLSSNSNIHKKTISNYLNNKLFINNLQDDCYGSVSKQIADFKKMMYLYKQENLINESINIEKILISNKEAENKEKLNNIISIGSLIFVILFGLPTIYESLIIIKGLFSIKDLIPYFSIEQISIL